MTELGPYALKVPIDATEIDQIDTERAIKVALLQKYEVIHSKTVCLNKSGKADVTFSFKKQPGALRIIVGPGDAENLGLEGLQSLVCDVAKNTWGEKCTLQLNPVKITLFHWYWWLHWCRIYTIRGRIICSDGRHVPGAEVCGYDVDHWFIWSDS